ncbi:PAS domain-containing protein [Floridanema aerugineum]|uniref:PAS domain-containing protein n=1 Tax=Floridaenema aerugineum BLCC-F46 TaxID=3153654 RepID=A0ABV4X079_9CYAN
MLSQTDSLLAETTTNNRVQLTTWKWKDFSANAYQLSDGSYVMTYRQMALKVNQDKNSAKNFVEKANLPSMEVKINNFLWANAVPLTTVLAYWKYLCKLGVEKQMASLGCQAIEEFLAEQERKALDLESSKPSQTLKTVYEVSILPNRASLKVLLLSDREGKDEYRIELESALRSIGVFPDWLDKLRPKTRMQLSEKGFSGVQQTHYITRSEKGNQIHEEDSEIIVHSKTIELSDYLVICQHFAERRSSVAIACLAALASEPLDKRIAKLSLNNLNLAVEVSQTALLINKGEKEPEVIYQLNQILQLVIDSIPQCIFWKNRDSVYLGCNRNFALVAGVETPKDIVGKTDYDLPWKKEESDWFRECDARVMETNTPEYYIIEPQLQANGKQSCVSTNKIPLHDSKGNVIGILGIYSEITGYKRVEEILQQLQVEVKQLLYKAEEQINRGLPQSGG